MSCISQIKVSILTLRVCLDFISSLVEILFGIFELSALANRPLFAAIRETKSPRKYFSTKLEIKSKQTLSAKIDTFI